LIELEVEATNCSNHTECTSHGVQNICDNCNDQHHRFDRIGNCSCANK